MLPDTLKPGPRVEATTMELHPQGGLSPALFHAAHEQDVTLTAV
ncbi:DUF6299 family protein [Streptomyces longwoodensis]